jgi:hypothetical protein
MRAVCMLSKNQTAGNPLNSRHISLPAGQPACLERIETVGKGIARRADELPVKEKQPGKSFTGRVIAGW